MAYGDRLHLTINMQGEITSIREAHQPQDGLMNVEAKKISGAFKRAGNHYQGTRHTQAPQAPSELDAMMQLTLAEMYNTVLVSAIDRSEILTVNGHKVTKGQMKTDVMEAALRDGVDLSQAIRC